MAVEYKTGQIFRKWGEASIEKYRPPTDICRVIRAIAKCRTPALGGRMIQCLDCGCQHFIYQSCGNRNCPICPALKKELWLLKRERELLPGVIYFHLVFTLPHELNPVFLNHPRLMYTLLFGAAWQSYRQLLGEVYGEVQGGMLAVLHTWGQNLSFHPHLHCIVPGAGLANDGSRWVQAKSPKFLLDVRVLSELFKKTFLRLLQEHWEFEGIDFQGSAALFHNIEQWRNLFFEVQQKNWVVWSAAPTLGAQQVLQYLGRYTHRVAFSENRILEVNDHSVLFQYKDYSDENEKGLPKTKQMELEGVEFIRKFCLHILPGGFQKIRYYGLWAPAVRKTKLHLAQRLLGLLNAVKVTAAVVKHLLLNILGINPDVCPHCSSTNIVTLPIPAQRYYLPSSPTPDNKSPPPHLTQTNILPPFKLAV